MRSSRKGVRYAVAGFILISLVALAGMSWATVASWRLAEWNVNQERLMRLHDAVERMDNYVLGILKVEAGRQYWEYVPWHTPELILDVDRNAIESRTFLLPSPLLSNHPQHDWIELYFQASEEGEWSSPHLTYEDLSKVTDTDRWSQDATNRARKTLGWLRSHTTIKDLQSRLLRAIERDQSFSGESESASTQVLHIPPIKVPSLTGLTWTDSRSDPRIPGRGRDPRSLQKKFIPPARCVPTDIAVEIASGTTQMMQAESLQSSEIEIRLTPLVPLWLDPNDHGESKLAFVRTVDYALEKVFQGFIGDWNRLRPELLRRVQDLLPEAELVQVAVDSDEADVLDPLKEDLELEQLPVRLVAGSSRTAAAEAWRSIRGVLLISWAGVIAVLAAAGWGIHNLVALTDRRLQFAYAVTHELRTPLTTFRLYTDMLSAGLVAEESKQDYLDTLNREAQRLSTLVEDVLDYARLENQKVRLNPINIEGDALLRRLNEDLEKRCKQNCIQAQAENDVPPGRPIHTDVELVSQIANVLVNNACRHARTSTDPTVLVHLGSENGHVYVDVVDSGPGVDRTDIRKIFKPFRRGRNADATAQGGIGLGLSLARNWAALLGGRLDLIARKHPRYGGAHFRLMIPASLKG